jgi:type VI secretion system ImpB/VipA family protein
MSGRVDFSLDFTTRTAQLKANPDRPYRIYILGCFSGASDNPGTPCKIHKIDRDTFEQVMAEMAPRVEIDTGISLTFAALEDFHPDAWLHKVTMINDLLLLKAQLQNPLTAAQATAKIQAFLSTEAAIDLVDSTNVVESQSDMLQRLLGKVPEAQLSTTASLEGFIKSMVAPHVLQTMQPQSQQLIAIIDTTVSQIARNILHNPLFQALEALWRGTDGLLNEEAAERHSFYLLDMGQIELSTEIKIDPQAFSQILLQHIQKSDAEQNVLLVGDYSFSGGAEDNALMAYCANLADACNGQFLATVDQAFLQLLPDLEVGPINETNSLMLVYPRYLLRLPYGNKRDPIDTFAFEECAVPPEMLELLWGNAAFLAARTLLRMTEDDVSGDAQFFGDTPAFSFEKAGESTLQPGTEVILTEAQANNILQKGIMPLIGYHQQRGIRLLGITNFFD